VFGLEDIKDFPVNYERASLAKRSCNKSLEIVIMVAKIYQIS
jgi:hypothetical protein